MATTEHILREKLAASHHIIHHIGCDDLLATHLSARIPGKNEILITPHNLPFEEVSASKLVKTDLEGRIIGDNGYYVMPQAVNIHAAVYRKKESVLSAMHTHSVYGTAVASLSCGLVFCHQHALRFYNDVAYHHYDGLALDNEGEMIAASLGDKRIMILKNHGLLTTGKSIDEACYLMYYLERICEMQIKILSAGQKIEPISAEAAEKTKAQYDKILSCEIDFEALVRRYAHRSIIDYRD